MNWIMRLLTKYRDRHDPAAVMQTPVQKFSGYSYQKARAGYLKAQGHTETGRKLAKPRTPKVATVTPIRRKQA